MISLLAIHKDAAPMVPNFSTEFRVRTRLAIGSGKKPLTSGYFKSREPLTVTRRDDRALIKKIVTISHEKY